MAPWKRTRCGNETIPAQISLTDEGKTIEIVPDSPVPLDRAIGVVMYVANPFNSGMYQFNALAQALGGCADGGLSRQLGGGTDRLTLTGKIKDRPRVETHQMSKRTLEGTSRKRKRVSGFRVRMRTHTGRRVIRSRRKRGRSRLAV